MNKKITWPKYYISFANSLLTYKNNRADLLDIIEGIYNKLDMKFPYIVDSKRLDDTCPFTVFGCFNKGISDDNRIALLQAFAEKFSITAELPSSFNGIPVLNNMTARFFTYKDNRSDDDIDNLWHVFETAINYADKPTEELKDQFIRGYNQVIKQPCVKWNITMGLYWIRPYNYLNLDEVNRQFLLSEDNPFSSEIINTANLQQLPDGQAYLNLISICNNYFAREDRIFENFPELSYQAWIIKTDKAQNENLSGAKFLKWFGPILDALKKLGGSGTPEEVRNQIALDLQLSDEVLNETRGQGNVKKFDNEVAFARSYLAYAGYIDKAVRGVWKLTEKGFTEEIDQYKASEIFHKWQSILRERKPSEDNKIIAKTKQKEIRYWIYSPGQQAIKWDDYYKQGIMGVGWDDLGDLTMYSSKEAMKSKLKELYGEEYTYKNAAHKTWQFANEMNPGDIVYVKKGLYELIGRGIVESDYIFDDSQDEYMHIRKVRWTHNGEWEHPGQAVSKALTDITTYTEYREKLEKIFTAETVEEEIQDEAEVTYAEYTEADFLGEVFMDADQYYSLVDLLKNKKNIILQGPPGVGKTFVAKRLAYSVMGECDTSRVMMVQFHQSYSYEDFMIGYRPTNEGFVLKHGPFYDFCKKAEVDNERDYYFIIDEINRGNLSKIFGELLMLIEKDKREEKLRLLYQNEQFSVPKNVHIIGMMNTADRSLAIIDYALRRRFAFFVLEPAFDTEGFQDVLVMTDNLKLKTLVEIIKELNEHISKDDILGEGFRIGHSYLCFDGDDEVTDNSLRAVIKHEILPLLDEYWFDERSKVEQWAKKLYGAIND